MSTMGSSDPDEGGTTADRVTRATLLLRQHTDAGWKAIEDQVLARASTLYRPSAPIRGRHDHGDFFLASEALVALLRRAVDELPQAAAQKITCVTGDRDELETVTVTIVAAYGSPLLDVAARVHAVTWGQLRDLLGVLAPLAENVRTHVHVGDVSKDPHLL